MAILEGGLPKKVRVFIRNAYNYSISYISYNLINHNQNQSFNYDCMFIINIITHGKNR